MREKLVLLVLFFCFICTAGKQYYLDCFSSIKEYQSLYKQVQRLEAQRDKLSITKEQGASEKKPKYSTFENIAEMCSHVSQLDGCTVTEISAINIISRDEIMYIARTENLSDVASFSDTLNGIQIQATVSDFAQVLKELQKMEMVIYSIDYDTETSEMILKTLII